MSETSLIQLSTDIDVLLQDSGGEITEEIQTKLMALAQKADGSAYVLARLEKTEEFYKQRAELINKMAKAAAKAQERLKEYIKAAMEIAGTNELVGEDFRFKASPSAPKVIIENEQEIPEQFKSTVVTTTPDKKRIAKALEAGATVGGTRLEYGVSLRCYPNKP